MIRWRKLGHVYAPDGRLAWAKSHAYVPTAVACDGELCVRTGASVRYEAGRWQMWYAGGERWVSANGKPVPSYQLRYLESADGVTWGRLGRVCLDFADDDECGFGRASVLRLGDR